MITLAQDSTNSFVLKLETRKSDSEYYMFEFTSLVTKYSQRVFPTLVTENPRFVEFSLDTTGDSPLDGNVKLDLSGSWRYVVYIVNSLSLTPTSIVSVDEGLMKLEESCAETTEYVFLSDNENANASVFFEPCDSCESWASVDQWELEEENWDC